MKYILIQGVTAEGVTRQFPIIFPESIEHAVVTDALLRSNSFCEYVGRECSVANVGFTDDGFIAQDSAESFAVDVQDNDVHSEQSRAFFNPIFSRNAGRRDDNQGYVIGEAVDTTSELNKKIDEIDRKISNLAACIDGLLNTVDSPHQCSGSCGGCAADSKSDSDTDQDVTRAHLTIELSTAEHKPKPEFNPPARKKIPSKLF